MPDWLTPLIIILSLVALALFVAYWNSRKTKYLICVGGIVALIVIVWLIAHLVPTDRKAIEAVIEDMAAGVRSKNPEQIFRHFAKDFRFRSTSKKDFESQADSLIRRGIVTEVLILRYDKVEISRSAKRADLIFRVKGLGLGNDQIFYYCEATFVLEADDQWRMQTFELYMPIGDRQLVPIPGF